MARDDQLRGNALTWRLEPKAPGVRYLALRDLLGLPPADIARVRGTTHRMST